MLETPHDHWVVLGKPGCGYCAQVNRLLDLVRVNFVSYNIDHHPSLRDFLLNSGLNTIPQIFHNGKLIGGFNELKERLDIQPDLFTEFM